MTKGAPKGMVVARSMPKTWDRQRRREDGMRAGGGRSKMPEASRAATMLEEALERSSLDAWTRAALVMASS